MDTCSFEANAMEEYWLSDLNFSVTNLEIKTSQLMNIYVDAFNSNVFKGTLSSLTIDNSLNVASSVLIFYIPVRGAFNGLTSLKSLTILNNPALTALDRRAFEILVDSLAFLRISRFAETWNPNVLLGSVIFKKLLTVDFQQNFFPRINGSSFTSIAENVEIFYLSSSNIGSIAFDTFENFKSLKQLFLQNNLLINLPTGVFDSLILISTKIMLQNNQWKCDCDFVPTQQMIQDNLTAFPGSIKCVAPPEMNNTEIVDAQICSVTEEAKSSSFSSTLSISNSPASLPDNPDCSNEHENNDLCSTLTNKLTSFVGDPTVENSSSSTLATDSTKSEEVTETSAEATSTELTTPEATVNATSTVAYATTSVEPTNSTVPSTSSTGVSSTTIATTSTESGSTDGEGKCRSQ